MTTSGIYAIKNIINNKMYIGQSINIERRWKIHKCKLNHLKHPNKHLQNEWNKYGKENFVFEIIEKYDSKLLKEKEEYWIKYYNTNNLQKGYNIAKGGNGGNINHICSEETKRKIAENNSIGKIVQLDFDGNIINIWNSVTEASRILKIHEASILNCAKHNFYLSYGYIWIFYNEFYYSNFNIKKYINEHKFKLNPTILQYDLYGNIIKEWKWKEIKNTFKSSYGTIRKICQHIGYNLTCNNCIWLYKDDDFNFTQEYLLKCRIKSSTVKIKQYDLNNNKITFTWVKNNIFKIILIFIRNIINFVVRIFIKEI